MTTILSLELSSLFCRRKLGCKASWRLRKHWCRLSSLRFSEPILTFFFAPKRAALQTWLTPQTQAVKSLLIPSRVLNVLWLLKRLPCHCRLPLASRSSEKQWDFSSSFARPKASTALTCVISTAWVCRLWLFTSWRKFTFPPKSKINLRSKN